MAAELFKPLLFAKLIARGGIVKNRLNLPVKLGIFKKKNKKER